MLRIQNLYTFAATRKGCCKAENIPVEPDAGNAAVGSLTALFSLSLFQLRLTIKTVKRCLKKTD